MCFTTHLMHNIKHNINYLIHTQLWWLFRWPIRTWIFNKPQKAKFIHISNHSHIRITTIHVQENYLLSNICRWGCPFKNSNRLNQITKNADTQHFECPTFKIRLVSTNLHILYWAIGDYTRYNCFYFVNSIWFQHKSSTFLRLNTREMQDNRTNTNYELISNI